MQTAPSTILYNLRENSSNLTNQALISSNVMNAGLQGKTTLLNVLMKRIPDLGTAHVQGSILLNGNSIPSWFPEAIGYVPQVRHHRCLYVCMALAVPDVLCSRL